MADAIALPSPALSKPARRLSPRVMIVLLGALILSLISGLAWGAVYFGYIGAGSDQSQGAGFDVSPAAQKDLIAATTGELATQFVEGEAAQKINAALPFTSAPLEASSPFNLAAMPGSNKDKALLCLTQAIYYEAGYEPVEGRRAVAQVILNRMRHPAFAKSVCGVVYQGSNRPGCQFSFTCDGSLKRAPAPAAWNEARRIAEEALAGHVATHVGAATHYHANYVSPYWAPKLAKLTQIGAHIFYRWPGGWGRQGAFTGRYAGNEFIPAPAPVQEGEALPIQLVSQPGIAPQAPDERRTETDIGGRLDPSKGWRLTIAMPGEANSPAVAAQHAPQVAQAAQPAPMPGAAARDLLQ